MPLLGEAQDELSGNPYIKNHLVYDLIYILILAIALYPLITIKRWQKKSKRKGLLVLEIIRHGVLPAFLICLPYFLGIPIWVVWSFVKDLSIVLYTGAALLLAGGIYKIKVSSKL